MSIIADTLQRLQQPKGETNHESPEETSPPQTTPSSRKAGRHGKSSRLKVLFIGLGMCAFLGSLGFAAYWVGLHFDFGLVTHASSDLKNPLRGGEFTPSESSEASLDIPPPTPSLALLPEGENTSRSQIPSPEEITSQSPPTIQSESIPQTKPHDPVASTSKTVSPSPQAKKTVTPIPSMVEKVVRPDHPTLTASSMNSQKTSPLTQDIVTSKAKDSVEEQGRIPENQTSQPIASDDLMASEAEQTVASLAVDESTEIPQLDQDLWEPPSQDMPPLSDPKEVTLHEERVETEEYRSPDEKNPTIAHRQFTKSQEGATNRSSAILFRSTPANHLKTAKKLIRSGEYDGAVSLLSPFFNDPPVDWEPWFWMGTALLGQGKVEQADQFFLSGLARNDKIPQLWIQRALVAQQQGEFQLAIYELRQAESLDNSLPHIPLNLGYAYEKLGNDRLAARYYRKFLKVSEGNPAFFETREKLFARLSQNIPAETPSQVPPAPLPSSILQNHHSP